MKDEMKKLTKLVSIRNTGLPTKDETLETIVWNSLCLFPCAQRNSDLKPYLEQKRAREDLQNKHN